MKATADHNHRNPIISYLFFGISSSIFILSLFFSFYGGGENSSLFANESRLSKPLGMSITELSPISLKDMLTSDAEAPLRIEPWMSEPTYVAPSANAYLSAPYFEPAIEIESWMHDLNAWSVPSTYNTVFESELLIEDWMLNANDWISITNANSLPPIELTENTLALESWMTDISNWSIMAQDAVFEEAPLLVEDWMLDSSLWLVNSK